MLSVLYFSIHCILRHHADGSKPFGGPSLHGNPTLNQPIGDSVAMAAATVMAGALGSAQNASTSNQIGFQSQSLGTDPLTRHLAKMSRTQLVEVMSDLKVSLLTRFS